MTWSDLDDSDATQGTIALDANVLDLDGTDRDHLVVRFRGLMDTGQITVMLPEGVARELAHPRVPSTSRGAAPEPRLQVRAAPTAAQHIARIRVRAILRGDAGSDKHAADAAHLCEAAEAGCRDFLTQDRRFSKKRHDLRAALPSIRVLGLREFFERWDAAESERGTDPGARGGQAE